MLTTRKAYQTIESEGAIPVSAAVNMTKKHEDPSFNLTEDTSIFKSYT